MRLFVLVAPSVFVSMLFWAALVACIDNPPAADAMPSARIVVQWDPLACGAPHRIAVELADEAGRPLSSSAPCALGGLTLEAPHFGVYLGRVYSWNADRPIRSITPVRLYVDEPIVRWLVATPE
jgi:hypothetical protein